MTPEERGLTDANPEAYDSAKAYEELVQDSDKAHDMANASDASRTAAANSESKLGEYYHNYRADRLEKKAGKEYDEAERVATSESGRILTQVQDILDRRRYAVSWSGSVGDSVNEMVKDQVLTALGVTEEQRQQAEDRGEDRRKAESSRSPFAKYIPNVFIENPRLMIEELISKDRDGNKISELRIWKADRSTFYRRTQQIERSEAEPSFTETPSVGLSDQENQRAESKYASERVTEQKLDDYHKTYSLIRDLQAELTPEQMSKYGEVLMYARFGVNNYGRHTAEQKKHEREHSADHFNSNPDGYKEQAVKEATEAGVDINYPPYTDRPLSPPAPETPQNPDQPQP